MRLLITCSTVLFAYCISHCQEFVSGYIIPIEGDTIHGQIKNNAFNKLFTEVEFRLDEQSTSTTYNPNEINGFFASPSMYFEVWNDENVKAKRFAKKLIDGNITLYKSIINQQTSYYLRKIDGQQLQISKSDTKKKDKITTDTKYIGLLRLFMQDCNVLAMQERGFEYKDKALKRLISAYNVCVGSDFEDLAPKRKLEFSISLLASGGLEKVQLTDPATLIPSQKVNGLTQRVALLADLSPSPYFMISTGLGYSRGSIDHQEQSSLAVIQNEISHQSITIPIIVKAIWNRPTISPYLNVGAERAFIISSNYKEQKIFSGTSSTSRDLADFINKGYSLDVGMGVRTQIHKKLNLAIGVNKNLNARALDDFELLEGDGYTFDLILSYVISPKTSSHK